jgi:hypothetical protein
MGFFSQWQARRQLRRRAKGPFENILVTTLLQSTDDFGKTLPVAKSAAAQAAEIVDQLGPTAVGKLDDNAHLTGLTVELAVLLLKKRVITSEDGGKDLIQNAREVALHILDLSGFRVE